MNDIHFDEVVDTYLDENLKEVMQDDEVMDELNDLFTLIPCQIGGYLSSHNMILVKKIVMKYCYFNLIHKIIFYGAIQVSVISLFQKKI